MEEIVKAMNGLIDKVYNGFVMNDLLSKITPGFIVIYTIAVSTGSMNLLNELYNIPAGWIYVLGIAWAVGIGLQSIGEMTRFALTWPSSKHYTIEQWYDDYFTFMEHAPEHSKTYARRFATILGVSGNFATSLLISMLIWTTFKRLSIPWADSSTYLQYGLLILLIFALRWYNREHRHRLFTHVTIWTKKNNEAKALKEKMSALF